MIMPFSLGFSPPQRQGRLVWREADGFGGRNPMGVGLEWEDRLFCG